MKFAVYTRVTEPEIYSSYLGNSIHFAISSEGTKYQSLNQNYGILFAKATIGEDNTIKAKGVKNPYIFRNEEGLFGIIATRINADGSEDEESIGKALLWTSNDLIHFSEEQMIDLLNDKRRLSVFFSNGITLISELANVEGAISGNVIEVEKEIINQLLLQWTPMENTDLHVPDSVTVSCRDEVEAVVAIASYSDGSTVSKKILWHTEKVDFTQSGAYEIEGTIIQNNYDFPLDSGYADPDILQWEGNFYFIATNDNTDNKGLFVRKAATIGELFTPDLKEYLILDVDSRRNLIQTFWAPEFHVIGNELYILFAVSGEVWGPQAHVMRLKKGGSILNVHDWENPIRVMKQDGTYLADGSDITLDMTCFVVEDLTYLVWSYRNNMGTPQDSGSMIYIATVNSKEPCILTSEPVLLSRPLFGWENNNQTINNEGPYALITGTHIYMTYSGGAAGGYSYVLGLLTANRGDDLLNVRNWSKSCTPVLSYYSIKGEYGPGHNAFFQDNDGNTLMVYHAQEQLKNSPRCIGIRRVHFDKDGAPRFDMSENRDLKDDFKKVRMKMILKKQ